MADDQEGLAVAITVGVRVPSAPQITGIELLVVNGQATSSRAAESLSHGPAVELETCHPRAPNTPGALKLRHVGPRELVGPCSRGALLGLNAVLAPLVVRLTGPGIGGFALDVRTSCWPFA